MQAVQRMLRLELVVQEPPQLIQLFGQVHRWFAVAAPQGGGGARQAARPASDAEVNPAGRQGSKDVEVLGHLVGAVMLEHDPAGADADVGGMGQQVRYQHLRRRPHHPAGAVMLGHPEPVIAPLLRLPGQLDGVAQGVRSVIPAFAGIRVVHRALVQDAQPEAHFSLISPGEGRVYCRSLTDYFPRWATLPYSCAIIRPNTALRQTQGERG